MVDTVGVNEDLISWYDVEKTRNSDLLVIVFDCNSDISYDQVRRCWDSMTEYNVCQTKFLIVANKCEADNQDNYMFNSRKYKRQWR